MTPINFIITGILQISQNLFPRKKSLTYNVDVI